MYDCHQVPTDVDTSNWLVIVSSLWGTEAHQTITFVLLSFFSFRLPLTLPYDLFWCYCSYKFPNPDVSHFGYKSQSQIFTRKWSFPYHFLSHGISFCSVSSLHWNNNCIPSCLTTAQLIALCITHTQTYKENDFHCRHDQITSEKYICCIVCGLFQ